MEKLPVLIGWIVKPHGVEGRMVVELFPAYWALESIAPDTEVYLGYSHRFALPYTLRSAVARGKRRLLVTIDQIATREEVYQFQEMGLFVPEAALRFEKAKPETDHPVVGYTVWEEGGTEPFGTVVDVWEMPANDVLVIRHQAADYPVPWVAEFVRSVDHEQRQIIIRLMEGISEIALPVRHNEQAMDEN